MVALIETPIPNRNGIDNNFYDVVLSHRSGAVVCDQLTYLSLYIVLYVKIANVCVSETEKERESERMGVG